MKGLFLFLLILCFAMFSFAQTSNANHDKKPAKTFHSDASGMKMYVLVLLKEGSHNVTDKVVRDSLFKDHFATINRLITQKKMVVAGEVVKNDLAYRGAFILDVSTMEEAKLLLAHDPILTEKILDTEFYYWYGPAALPAHLLNRNLRTFTNQQTQAY